MFSADALAWLPLQTGQGFELVFLDPPFAGDIWPGLWPLLTPVLADIATLYIELPVDRELVLPVAMRLLKQGNTRQSRQMLLRWQKPVIG